MISWNDIKKSTEKPRLLPNNGATSRQYTLQKGSLICFSKSPLNSKNKNLNSAKDSCKRKNHLKVSKRWSKCWENKRKGLFLMTWNLSVKSGKDNIRSDRNKRPMKYSFCTNKNYQKSKCKETWNSAAVIKNWDLLSKSIRKQRIIRLSWRWRISSLTNSICTSWSQGWSFWWTKRSRTLRKRRIWTRGWLQGAFSGTIQARPVKARYPQDEID